MPNERTLILATVAAIGFFVAGVFVGRHREPAPPIMEAARPAIVHPSGAVTLERIQPSPTRRAPKPLELAPGTTTTTHTVKLEVAPSEKPREIQLDIQEGKDGTRVTVAGEGVTGQDFTLPRPPPPTVQKWTLGAAYDGKTFGPMVAYQWRSVTVGALATRNQTTAFIGIRF